MLGSTKHWHRTAMMAAVVVEKHQAGRSEQIEIVALFEPGMKNDRLQNTNEQSFCLLTIWLVFNHCAHC